VRKALEIKNKKKKPKQWTCKIKQTKLDQYGHVLLEQTTSTPTFHQMSLVAPIILHPIQLHLTLTVILNMPLPSNGSWTLECWAA